LRARALAELPLRRCIMRSLMAGQASGVQTTALLAEDLPPGNVAHPCKTNEGKSGEG
jgi:hypothetical protein